MDPPNDVVSDLMATASLDDGSQSRQARNDHQDMMTTDVMRVEKQILNQCFEMAVKVQAERNLSELEPERDLLVLVRDLEAAKLGKTALNNTNERLQMLNIYVENLLEDDPYRQRLMDLLENIQSVQKESRELEERVVQIQKEKLEVKRRTLEKIKEAKDLQQKTPPESKELELCQQKALDNVEKYKKMIELTQNVLQDVLIGCKLHWMDDPKIRDIFLHRPSFE